MKKTVYLSVLFLSPSWALDSSNSVDRQTNKAVLEEIVVTSHLLSDKGLAQSATVLTAQKLEDELQASLGATIASVPGIRSASFGGAVGRPVIHGLGGARIKTTQDRIDSLDVSVTSADHAVTLEPFMANQINILKGASTLLYGSGAIGGVVDVDTGRIPKERPLKSLVGRVELRAADNANAKMAAARVDGAYADSLAWHIDAFTKQADDYDISGDVESQALREAEGDLHEQEASAELLGSRYDVTGGAIGASFISEDGFVGLSVSTLQSEYGLVGGHGHEEYEEHEEHEEGHSELSDMADESPGRIELNQVRVDIEGQLNSPFQGVKALNFRLGINDYQHQEIEGNGEVGTVFNNDAWEGRLEMSHSPVAQFDGVLGFQLSNRDFSATGAEAFVPPVETRSVGAFWVGQREFDAVSIEAGVRVESVNHQPMQSAFSRLDFMSESASLGFIVPLGEFASLAALADYTQRAPAVEELYSFGPHLATQTFEVGNASLNEESALGFSVSFHYHSDLVDVQATLYNTNFNDFIYQYNTGQNDDGLPVFNYVQDDADFTGIDFEAALHLAQVFGGDLDVSANFDTVTAEIDAGGHVPRIPANRQGVGLAWSNAAWQLKLQLKHVNKQEKLAAFELLSESYSDVSFRVTRRVMIGENELKLFVHGRNLTNQEQREHVSFVKDVAPAPGRRIEAGLRFLF